MALFCNSTLLVLGLNRLAALGKKVCLCSSDPTTKLTATGAICAGISTHLDFTAAATSTFLAIGGASPMKIGIKKTSDISARASSTKWVTHFAIIGDSTLLYVTKCSSRSFSTAGPDKITASSWYIHFLGPATSTG